MDYLLVRKMYLLINTWKCLVGCTWNYRNEIQILFKEDSQTDIVCLKKGEIITNNKSTLVQFYVAKGRWGKLYLVSVFLFLVLLRN